MKKRDLFFVLYSLFMPFMAYSYVMSETLIQFPDRTHPDILILGDAHYDCAVAHEHAQLIKDEIEKRSEQGTTLYVSLEDRPWENITKGSDTLHNLVCYARGKNRAYGSVTFGSSDCRPRPLVWTLFFTSKYEDGNRLDVSDKYSETLAWLDQIYGLPVPTAQDIVQTMQRYVKHVKKIQKSIAVDLTTYIKELDENMPIVCDALSAYGNQPISAVFLQWLQEDSTGKKIGALYAPLLFFLNAMSEIGFLLDYLENKDHFDQVIFFVGHAHACSLAQSLCSMNQHDDKIRVDQRGPRERFLSQKNPIPTKDVSLFFKALSSRKKEKSRSRGGTAIDLLLFVMVGLVGLLFFVPRQRERRRGFTL